MSAGAIYAIDEWRAELRGRYVGKQYLDQLNAGTPTQATIPSYYLLDLDIAKVIPIHGSSVKGVRLGFDAKNLTNKYYYNEAYTDQANVLGADGTVIKHNMPNSTTNFIRAVPGAPRSFLGSVSIDF